MSLVLKVRQWGLTGWMCLQQLYIFNCDMVQAAHGRAPPVATGIKRVHPDNFVFTYQGDGDLAAIGTAEIVHAATRGEKITVIFINNAIYGMTSANGTYYFDRSGYHHKSFWKETGASRVSCKGL